MRCRIARRRIDAALERELTLEQRFELEEHLAGCPACTLHERRARGLQELLEDPGELSTRACDVDAAAAAVLAALDGNECDRDENGRGQGEPWRPRAGRRRARLVGAALALAAGLALILALRDGAQLPVAQPVVTTEEHAPAPTAAEAGEWTTPSVEACVRAALLECFESAGVDELRARQRFRESTREPARSGWPVRRFVEGLLESPDTAVALAAARCLGALGEAYAAPALERALRRPALAEETLDALGDLGEPALGALERALAQPELGSRALLQICRIGGARAAAALERAARDARADGQPSREALLDALTSTGPAAVGSLLGLAAAADEQGPPGSAADILARLPLVAEAGAELVRTLERERLAGDLAYRALLALRPPEALTWLEERCLSQRERGPALEVLSHFEGTPPLGAVLRLARGGRVPRTDVLVLLVGLFEREAERAEEYSAELVAGSEVASAREWLALLIESAHEAAARALVPLVLWAELAPEDRQWAALALGELGTHDDAERLRLALAGALPADRRLLAACLLSIHAQLGAAGIESLLAGVSDTGLGRVLAALADQGRTGEAVRVHRVARALDGVLAELAATPLDKKEVL